ncbi:unnamed protein product, partial [Heterotrigona itama]
HLVVKLCFVSFLPIGLEIGTLCRSNYRTRLGSRRVERTTSDGRCSRQRIFTSWTRSQRGKATFRPGRFKTLRSSQSIAEEIGKLIAEEALRQAGSSRTRIVRLLRGNQFTNSAKDRAGKTGGMTAIRGIASCICLTVFVVSHVAAVASRPHIVFILADDLGWNDVGFHGSGQIPTPNIDALAYSGLLLDRYYVTPICTPSRSALMTGKHPIHTGMQHGVLKCAEPRGLPLHEKLLPEYLRELGYSTHIVGKWHLGFYTKEYTPTYRGFDSHLGLWSGHHDYFDHSAVESPYWGLDMRRGLDAAWDLHGQYSTDIFTKEAVRLIDNHNTSRPMFLYLAHAAVHSGNPYNPLPAPDQDVSKFTTIFNYDRRRFAGS